MKAPERNATRKFCNVVTMRTFKSFRFDGDNYVSTELSKYSHYCTFGLANYMGKALTTGCWSSECAVKTELMDMNTLTWSAGPDYPFISESYQ